MTELPEVLALFADQYPRVWDAYHQWGNAAAEAGPLDEKSQRLIKRAIVIGSQRQGHSTPIPGER